MNHDLSEILASAKDGDYWAIPSDDDRYAMTVVYPAVSVYDTTRVSAANPRGVLVAFSAMKADFDASLAEFFHDYITEKA